MRRLNVKKLTSDRVLVVSRHPTFVSFVKERLGLSDDDVEVVATATPDMLRGKVVVTSSLPLPLMAEAEAVITVDLSLPRDPQERAQALKELESSADAYGKYLMGISLYKVQREVIQ